MKTLLIHFLILLLCNISLDGLAETKTHFKDAISLMGDSEKLIALGCEAINSSSFEKEDVERIMVLADEYNIASLHEIIKLRKSRQLDAGDKLANMALGQLIENIERRHKGNLSYEEVYVRLVRGMLCHEESKRMEYYNVASDKAQNLLIMDKDNILYKELMLVSKILYIANSTDIYGPTRYKEFKQSLLELLGLYNNSDMHSFLRQELGGLIVNYLSYLEGEGYTDYCKFIDSKLNKENRDVFRNITIENLLLARKEETLLRRTSNHPNMILVEANLCFNTLVHSNNKIAVVSALDKLNSLYMQAYKYFGADSYIANYLDLNHSLYSIENGNKNPEFTDDMRRELAVLQKMADEDYESVLGVLCRIMGTFVNVSPDVAVDIYREIEIAAERIRPNDVYGYFTALCNKLYLQRNSVSGYEVAAEEMKHLLNEYSQEKNDWRFVKMAQSLLHSLLHLYGKTAETLELNQLVYESELQLLVEDKELSVFSGINYVTIKNNSFAVIGDSSFDKHLGELSKEANSLGINTSKVLLLRTLQCLNSKEMNRGMVFLRQAIDESDNTDMTIELYSMWLNSFSGLEQADKDITQRCVECLDSLFEKEYNELKVEHMDGYYVLAQYYDSRNELSHSNRILQRCYEYYNDESVMPDDYYTMFAIAMMRLYTNGYGDLEQCRLLLNDVQQRLDKVKAFVGYDSYLALLRNCYDLVEYKSPNDYSLLASYLFPMRQAYVEYFSINNNSEDVFWMHLPYILVKTSNIYRGLRLQNDRNPTKEYEQMRNNVLKQFEPLMNRAVDLCKNVSPHIKSSENYYMLLMGLGQMYEYLIDDQQEADYYYKIMREQNTNHGDAWYMGYLIRRGKWKEALPIAESVRPILDQEIDNLRQRGHIGSYSELVGMLFNIFFKNGHYDKASYYASLYMQMRKDVIDTNFDYFTSQERESFIMQGGAGGAPTFALLANMNGDINEKAYNAVLQEKGLLLRSSERVRNAIKSSGNQRLIDSMDSIRVMSQSLLAIKDDANMNEETMKFASSLRSKIDKLEHYVSTETAKYRDSSDEVLSWEKVRDSLKDGEVAIEFVHGDSAIHALIIAPNCRRPQAVTVLNREDFTYLSKYFSEQSDITERMKLLYDNEANKLYHTIWEPLMPYIGNAKTVFYSPTGILCALSFCALQMDDQSYLIDHYELRQLTTTANIVRHRQRDSNPKDIKSAIVAGGLCYENIQLSSVDEEVNWAKQNSNPIVAQREALQSFDFLPFSYIEMENIIATLAKKGISITEKSLMDAKESNMRKLLDGGSADIIHISTHGFCCTDMQQASEIPYIANSGQPTSLNTAGLALSNANLAWEGEKMSKEIDNILTADEISALDLRKTKLAVLSACNTALGSTSLEGIMGLQRGLKQAGVETLCLSLWNVNDASSSSLMSMFYENWLGGDISKSEAMRIAMTKQKELTPSPYFWAPFILIDDIQ